MREGRCGMEAADLSRAEWRKSSYSGGNGNCVETASGAGIVAVRDTTDRDGGTLSFTANAWRAFMANVKHS
jgi:hypothetical protein